jgi:glutathione-regulated potassium-efflux system ancillary protein KefG
MASILILFAHPAFEHSRTQRALVAAASDLPGVTLHDLYEAYPTFHVARRAEQALLRRHDIILFQHPLYWFSAPALLKQWQDVVLEHGWAYGEDGLQLRGKVALHAVSTSAAEFDPEHGIGPTCNVRQFLSPWETTAQLCGMRFLAPFVVHGFRVDTHPEQLREAAANYRALLEALRDGRADLDKAAARPALNYDLSDFIRPPEGTA